MARRELTRLAEAFARTYTVEEILELADLTVEDLILLLLEQGLLDPEIPHELEIDDS